MSRHVGITLFQGTHQCGKELCKSNGKSSHADPGHRCGQHRPVKISRVLLEKAHRDSAAHGMSEKIERLCLDAPDQLKHVLHVDVKVPDADL